MKKILWHLPGLYSQFGFYQKLFDLIKQSPYIMKDNHEVHLVYGAFPNTIWNCGRCVVEPNMLLLKDQIKNILSFYDFYKVKIALTWSNHLLSKDHLSDQYCNMITNLCNKDGNYVICYTDLMREYIREKYLNYRLICSMTRPKPHDNSIDIDKWLDKFEIVVLNKDNNKEIFNNEYLESVANRVEILVNQRCVVNCPNEMKHYDAIANAQLHYELSDFKCVFNDTINSTRLYVKPYDATQFDNLLVPKDSNLVTVSEVEELAKKGFCHFKIQGRYKDPYVLLDTIIYYMIKDEYKNLVYSKMRNL